MTLQIVSRVEDKETVVELHGWLTGLEIAELEGICASRPQPIRLDLRNLSGASAIGILALKEQQARGAVLVGASPYIELLLSHPSREGGAGVPRSR